VGEGWEMVGLWQGQSRGMWPVVAFQKGLLYVPVLCTVRFNYLFFSVVIGTSLNNVQILTHQ